MISRREFVVLSSAGASWSALARWDNLPKVPRARVGLLTDTHIDDNPESCRFVGDAFRLFSREKVDTILHAGDLATVWSEAGYREYRRLFHETFAGSEPRELFSYGQHDGVKFPTPLKAGQKWYDVKWPAFAAAMETDQPYQVTTTLGGFPLIVFPQKWVEREYDELIALVDAATKANPGKPVFVLRHLPIVGTTSRSDAFDCGLGDRARMAKYPNVIMLTGHVHEDLHDEGAIWQEGFTAVGLGTLQWPRLFCVGRPIGIYRQTCAMTMNIFDDRAEFVRWNIATGRTIGEKWVVHWGLHPELLGAKARRERENPGRFGAGAKATVEADGKGGCVVRFPEISEADSIHRYEVRAKVGGKLVAVVGVRGPWFARDCGGGRPEARFRDGIFANGERVSFEVVPITFLGKRGPTLSVEWEKPVERKQAEECWRGELEGEKVAKYPFGFMFKLPSEAWKGKAGTRFRISLGLSANGEGTLSAYSEKRKQIIGSAIEALYAVGGKDGEPLRYALDFAKTDDDDTYSLYFAGTLATKAKLTAVRIEK